MNDRDELADLLESANEADEPESWHTWKYRLADAILARWRLVPVPCGVPYLSPDGRTLATCDGIPGHGGQHFTNDGGGITWT